MIFSKSKREARRALLAAHRRALAAAQETYDQHRHEETVITQGEGPGYSYITAASPEREAWDRYFYSMRDQGQDGWKTKRLFDQQLQTQ